MHYSCKVHLVRYSVNVLLMLACGVLAIIVIIVIFMDGNNRGTHFYYMKVKNSLINFLLL